MSISFDMALMAQEAKQASRQAAQLTTIEKNTLLSAMANAIEANCDNILEQNKTDIANGEQKGLSAAMLDRLLLTPQRISNILAA